jgi:hypothetical protein
MNRTGTRHIIIALMLLFLAGSFVIKTVSARESAVQEVTDRLRQRGIPVRGEIQSLLPYRVKFILQSSSVGTLVSPDDPTFEQAVYREIALAKGRSLRFDAVELAVVNTAGTVLYTGEMPSHFILPAGTALPDIDGPAISNRLASKLSTPGITFASVRVDNELGTIHRLSLNLVTADLQTANTALSTLMGTVYPNILNENSIGNAHIGVYQITLSDAAGNLLLKYSRDLELSQENWWQAPDLTQDWFPHPALTQ